MAVTPFTTLRILGAFDIHASHRTANLTFATLQVGEATIVFDAATTVAHLSKLTIEIAGATLSAANTGAVVADFALFAVVVARAFTRTTLAASEFPALGDLANVALALGINAASTRRKFGAFLCGRMTELIDGAVA